MGDDSDPLVLLILADGNKHNIYFLSETKKEAAFRCMGVNLIKRKVEEHVHSWRGDPVSYIRVICDREGSWIETCKIE